MKKIRLISNIISISLLVGYTIFLIIVWRKIPNVLPTHFEAAVEADSYGKKITLILMPILGYMILFAIIFFERFPNIWNFPVEVTDRNRNRLYMLSFQMMAVVKIMMVVLFIYIGFLTIYYPMPIWPMYLIFGIMFGAIILSIVRMIRAK